MGLINNQAYIRLNFGSGYSNTDMTISWKVYPQKEGWENNNPQSLIPGIIESGQCNVNLAIKETQETEVEGENGPEIQQEEVVIGYHPQTVETAHELLKLVDFADARFSNYEWEVDI